jgi:DNA-binding Lrp family transcriptional regulator
MKEKDLEILKQMRKGKRLNISEIARQLNLPISTVSDTIRRIEERYVLKRASLLDYSKLGYSANANLAIKAYPPQKNDLLKFLKNENCVNSIYHVNEGNDFLIDVVFRNWAGLKEWVSELKNKFAVETSTFHILKTEEKERFVPK